jgi:transposase
MQTVSTIGLDIAKSVFQVHGVDANGQVVIRRQLKRRYVLAFGTMPRGQLREPHAAVGTSLCDRRLASYRLSASIVLRLWQVDIL